MEKIIWNVNFCFRKSGGVDSWHNHRHAHYKTPWLLWWCFITSYLFSWLSRMQMCWPIFWISEDKSADLALSWSLQALIDDSCFSLSHPIYFYNFQSSSSCFTVHRSQHEYSFYLQTVTNTLFVSRPAGVSLCSASQKYQVFLPPSSYCPSDPFPPSCGIIKSHLRPPTWLIPDVRCALHAEATEITETLMTTVRKSTLKAYKKGCLNERYIVQAVYSWLIKQAD